MALCGVVNAWAPGKIPSPPARMTTSGFSVNVQDRNDVIAFWHAVYQASEGYENRIKWTGNYTGDPGTVAAPFVADVERRLNYFRAMCGVPASANLNTGSKVVVEALDPFKPPASTSKAEAAQLSALMLIRNYNWQSGINLAITHNPANTLKGWSPAAWNASAHGSFAFGLYGPGAITEYMIEALTTGSATSTWNTMVGHRRWNLFPGATDFATGDQPGQSAKQPPTNVLYVFPNKKELLTLAPTFVAYPPGGYFPAFLNSPYWSLSCPDGDFSSASVKVTTSNGSAVPVSGIQKSTGFGDPAIIWKVGGGADTRNVYADTKFTVTVSGISSETLPSTHTYTVTLINPDRLTSNQALTGSASPKAGATTKYTFVTPPGAEALQIECLKRVAGKWTENAQNESSAKVIDDTGANYNLIEKPTIFGFSGVSGTQSFHLTFPTAYELIARGVPEQSFEIDRDIIAKTDAKLKFMYRRGFMTTTSKLAVEISSNDGVTWKRLGKLISGISNTTYDNNVTSVAFDLPKSNSPVRIRFRYYTTGGSIYTHEAAPKSPTGIFIDEITTVKCDELIRKKVNSVALNSNIFAFNSTTAGTTLKKGNKWQLRMRTVLGGHVFRGPGKAVTIAAP
jgi:hypothetical protein